MISPTKVMNISSASTALIVGLEEDEPTIPEASRVKPATEAEPVASVSVPSQPNYRLLSSIKSKLIGTYLERIKTMHGIPNKYQLRVANPKERAD